MRPVGKIRNGSRPQESPCESPFWPIRFKACHLQHPSGLSGPSYRDSDQTFVAQFLNLLSIDPVDVVETAMTMLPYYRILAGRMSLFASDTPTYPYDPRG